MRLYRINFYPRIVGQINSTTTQAGVNELSLLIMFILVIGVPERSLVFQNEVSLYSTVFIRLSARHQSTRQCLNPHP